MGCSVTAHTLQLPEILTADVVAKVQAHWLQKVSQGERGEQVQLDVSGVQSFDSAGLALLLACRRAALQKGRKLTVCGWKPDMLSLAQVYGVLPLLDSSSTISPTS